MGLTVALQAAGCGYKLGGAPSNWSLAGKKMAIPIFSNNTTDPDAEIAFTMAARETFSTRKGIVVTSRADADWILTGTVLSLDDPVATRREMDTGHRVASHDLTARVRLQLTDKSGMPLWETTLFERSDFSGNAKQVQVSYNRQDALKRLATHMMEQAYTELAEGF